MFNLVLFYTEGSPYDKGYKLARYINKVIDSAKPNVDNLILYTPRILNKLGCGKYIKEYNNCGLVSRNPNLNNIGFCAWKPKILLLELEKMKDGDILVYRDSNCRKYKHLANYDNFRENCLKILEICGSDFFVFRQNDIFKTRQFCKTNVINELGCGDFSLEFPLLLAGFIIVKKSEFSIELLKKWLLHCENTEYIDGEKYGDLDKYFKWHTPEQGILSVIISEMIKNKLLPLNYPKLLLTNDLGNTILATNYNYLNSLITT